MKTSRFVKPALLVACLMTRLAGGTLFAETDDSKTQKFRGWYTAETEHFTFIYEDAARETAQAYALIADDAWNKVSKIYGFPQEKTNVYVTDRTNTVNAYTYYTPVEIMMFTTPPTIPDFTFRADWRTLFFTHELVHSANFAFEDRPVKKVVSTMFGPLAGSLFDYETGWALEGLATVLETELTAGGRGRSPYFELSYKAPTLDNAYISYKDVAQSGAQSYITGYLMMRSIADRWGLSTLADIERNRPLYGSWDNAVKRVTGEEAEDIFKDVSIALAKKYADERKIPEGLIISPRTKNTSYYKPAIVLDDGSIITLRSTNDDYVSVVKLNPSARSGRNTLKNTHPEKDLNSVFKETVLFRCMVPDSNSVTADENGTVYAVLEVDRFDKMPGLQAELPLYVWTEKSGLKKLTKHGSFFQPSVSRDGSTLVAVQQSGLNMRLVQVDVATGKITPLLQETGTDFFQPAVNADGTKVTFIAADGTRARVCVMDIDKADGADGATSAYEEAGTDGTPSRGGADALESGTAEAGTGKRVYSVVANDGALITDPAYPAWNSNGNITYTSNDRGRLEVYEAAQSGGSWKSTPVVADPIGALWAYQGARGVYYWAYSAGGYVLKMKPAAEWGNVPAYNGPSMPGEVVHLGSLQRDYPDFQPYEVPSEAEESLDRIKLRKERNSAGTGAAESGAGTGTGIFSVTALQQESDEPVPVTPKKLFRRPQELTERAEALTESETKTGLENEHRYVPTLSPLAYFPFIDFDNFGITEESNFGFGGFFMGLLPKLQMMPGAVLAGGLYYPRVNNFSLDLMAAVPIGPVTIGGMLSRTLDSLQFSDEKHFCEINKFSLVYQQPLYFKAHNFAITSLSLVGRGDYSLIRHAPETFAFFEGADIKNTLDFQFGMNLMRFKMAQNGGLSASQITLLGIADYDFSLNRPFFGAEGEIALNPTPFPFLNPALDVCIRYTDFPSEYVPLYSRAAYNGEHLDCTYPGRIKLRLGIGLFFGQLFGETCFSFGKNTVDFATADNGTFMNFSWSDSIEIGYALTVLQIMDVGISYQFHFDDSDKNRIKFFMGVSFGAMRM